MRPRRIWQRRLKGWRKPPGAVAVGRPTKWANNAYKAKRKGDPVEHAKAVALFRAYLHEHPELVAAARVALRGKVLMCWCPLHLPCHADVWLEVVNA